MSNSFNNLYGFEEFRFDAETCTLWRDNKIISLPPKASEVLRLLIEHNGKLVTKQEILSTVWAETFVEDGVLTQSVYLLRQTLEADNKERQFIQTVARRGYRFGVPVKVLNSDEMPAAVTGKALSGSENSASLILGAEYLEGDDENAQNLAPKKNDPTFNQPLSTLKTSFKTDLRPFFDFRKTVFVVVVVFLLIVLGFMSYRLFNREAEKSNNKIAPIEQLRFQRLTDFGDVIFPTISPNGELLVFVRHEEVQESVWVKQIATDAIKQILPPSPKGYASLAFSPDGKYLYFREESEGSSIYQTTVFGATPKKVAENVWSDFSVSPDGRQFAFVRRAGEKKMNLLILANIDGSGERELTARAAPLDFRGTPAWSPDGGKLVIAAGIQSQFFPNLLMIDVSNGIETELKTPRWRAIPRTLWMPNGKFLIISAREANESSSQIWMLSPFDGEVRRLTNDLEGYFWLSLSADGRKLVTRQQQIVSHLWLLPGRDQKNMKQLTFGFRNLDGYVGLAWSPDGKIIFSGFYENTTDLYSINADGTNKKQLTANNGPDNTNPAVSNDGKYIVYTSEKSGTTQVWRMDIDGRNPKQLTFGEEQTERSHSPVLSPDGREVFFIKRAATPSAIWKVPIEGGNAVQISRLNNGTPESFLSISPDGKWLAYRHISAQPETGNESPTFRIGVISTDGNADPKLFDLPMRRPRIQWSADSMSFDYAAGTFNSSSLWRQSLNSGEPKKLFDFPDRIFNFAWSGDGKNLAVSRGKQQGDAILISNLP